jgi:hypothetical protein
MALLEKCRSHALALERRLAAGLNARSQRDVRRWLTKIATYLQRDGEAARQCRAPTWNKVKREVSNARRLVRRNGN